MVILLVHEVDLEDSVFFKEREGVEVTFVDIHDQHKLLFQSIFKCLKMSRRNL